MDTKSKSNKKSLKGRILILVICISLLPVLIGSIKRYNPREELYNTSVVKEHIMKIYDALIYMRSRTDDIYGEPNESTIKDEINRIRTSYQSDYDYFKEQVDSAKASGYDSWSYRYTEEQMNVAEKTLNKNEDEVRKEAVNNIEGSLSYYRNLLKQNLNIEFYIETKGKEKPFTNVYGKSSEEFEEETLSGEYDDYIIVKGISRTGGDVGANVSDTLIEYANYNPDVYNLSNDFYLRIKKPLESGDDLYTYAKHYENSKRLGYASMVLLGVDILCIIGLLISIKKNLSKVKENILIKMYRKLYLEIRILSYIAIIYLVPSTYSMVYWGNIRYIIFNLILLILLGYLVFSDLFIMGETYNEGKLKEYCVDKCLIIKTINLIKESALIKSTRIRVICSLLYLIVYATALYFTGIFVKSLWLHDILTMSSMTISAIMTIGIIIYVLKLGKQINTLKISTDNIVKGNYNNNIEVKGPMVLKDIARNVRNIEDGLSKAVEKAVSSEKMKGELITNVSHDLKTPLTSIINYVDLLSKKNISQEDKARYIGVLKEKSARLKVLIEDLFEASKAASGAMELSMENIDAVALLRQTIGEFEDRIEASGLQFIKRVPEEKLIVYADGRKTFRVFQNLISNILKYSMPCSRVYIEAKEEANEVFITFKNISKFELDFSEEEIMERFKRGDASRTTEGSGLGLSIAKSLIELQGGDFNISIDGDLFKATVSLSKGSKLI